jgi:D-alanine-D-alanine ligase
MERLKIGMVFDNTGVSISKKRPTRSTTHQVSVERESVPQTAEAIEEVLVAEGHEVVRLPIDYPLRSFVRALAATEVDLIFNLCDDVDDNSHLEPCVAGLLELLGIRYTGSALWTLALTLSKPWTKALLISRGLRTPGYFVADSPLTARPDRLSFPLIVKPANEDASIGISSASVVRSENQLRKQVDFVLENFRQPALVEEFVEGREVNVGIAGNMKPQVLPLSEISFSSVPAGAERIVTYRGKWVEDSVEYTMTVPICPAKVDDRLATEIRSMALAAYEATGCHDYARVDFRLKDGEIPYILEVNANPDIGPGAGLARSARAFGWQYRDLVLNIVEFALERSGADFLLPRRSMEIRKLAPGDRTPVKAVLRAT